MTKNVKTQTPHERHSLNSLVEKMNPSLPFLVKVHEVWPLFFVVFIVVVVSVVRSALLEKE